MAKKIGAATFAAIFILALAIPALNTNLAPNQKSELDNRMLNELPDLAAVASASNAKAPVGVRAYTRELTGQAGAKMSLVLETIKGFTSAVEVSLQDRVGFRTEMLTAYLELNDALFGVMAHPLHMYGKEGHLYYRGQEYIRGYQNIYDEASLDKKARYLARIESFLEARDVDFFFFLIPDKKTIYPEYFPAGINKTDAPPLLDAFLARLNELSVNYVSPREPFLSIKNEVKLYNKQFDVTHWSDDGAFAGVSLLLEKIHEEHAEVPRLNMDDYEREIAKAAFLPNTEFKINEDVPKYTAKRASAAIDEAFSSEVFVASGEDCAVYENSAMEGGLTALIFHDSYLADTENFQSRRFLAENFRRAAFVHGENLHRLAWYLNIFDPDIVIFETVERMMDSAWARNIDNAFFPQASSLELALDAQVNVLLEKIDVARGERITAISARLVSSGAEVTQVYARVGEREYPAQVTSDGRFLLALANAALEGAGGIALIPANEEAGVRHEALELSGSF